MKTLYAVSLLFGILAAVLSGVHGVGEVLQEGSPAGVMINAWGSDPFSGAACQESNCFPAMTILTFLPFSIFEQIMFIV